MDLKIKLLFNSLLIILLMTTACTEKETGGASDVPTIAIIPQPEKVIIKSGVFELNTNTSLQFDSDNVAIGYVVKYLEDHVGRSTGLRFSHDSSPSENTIVFSIDITIQNKEGYHLSVDSKRIQISASKPAGLFYGVQSLLQLLPPEVYANTKQENVDWVIPAVEIEDAPRFTYRGLHLDVGRYFFNVEEVKKYIDGIAMHKMNTFHWHLTEDQGWRIEIKKYPKLTEIGAFRDGTLVGHYTDKPHQFDGKRYGGFYTQEEIKEVVQYAKERFVTVIPEIELPGHAQAALAAYPELACTDEPLGVMQLWGVSENVFCPTEATFTFLENVLEEVMALFPSKYIHIGGDECPKTKWEESDFCQALIKREGLKDEHELQSWFIQRIEKFINSKGRNIIGWDEILEGGLAPNATVMSWRGESGGIEAAKQKHNVIMTPTTYCYFDYYQSDHPEEPIAIGGLLKLNKVYSYNPIPESLTSDEEQYILGVQGNLWTEYIPTYDKVEYMVYPRATAIAEVGWSTLDNKDFTNFTKRLSHQFKRFEFAGINAANQLHDLKIHSHATGEGIEIELKALVENADFYYTLNGETPTLQSKKYNQPFYLSENAMIKSQAFLDGKKIGRGTSQNIHLHQAAGKSISLKKDPSPIYAASGNSALINGISASNENFNDGEWMGFNGDDLEAVINFGKPIDFKQVKFTFFKGEDSWIYLPSEVNIFSSDNGKDYTLIGTKKDINGNTGSVPVEFSVDNNNAQYLKAVVKNFGGHPKNGEKVWLFVDEIVVE